MVSVGYKPETFQNPDSARSVHNGCHSQCITYLALRWACNDGCTTDFKQSTLHHFKDCTAPLPSCNIVNSGLLLVNIKIIINNDFNILALLKGFLLELSSNYGRAASPPLEISPHQEGRKDEREGRE